MTDDEIKWYHAVRASVWLPTISDKEALVEAQALVHFLTITYRDN